MEVAASTANIKINSLVDRSRPTLRHFRNAMRLALAALEACLRDERWVGMGVKPWKKEGEDTPADVPVYGHWVPLASQMTRWDLHLHDEIESIM